MPKAKEKRAPGLSFTSCKRCRVRKIKCDDGFPCCSSCKKANVECFNFDPSLKKDVPRNYVQTLLERLKSLELEIANYKNSNDCFVAAVKNDTSLKPVEVNSSRDPVDNLTDMMGIASSQLTSSVSKEEFTSEMQFLKLVFQSFQRKLYSTRHPILKSLPNIVEMPSGPCLVDISKNYVLPPRDEADQLIEIYFSVVNSIFPILHQVEFATMVDNLYNPQASTFKPCRDLYLLNLVLAVGAGSAGTDAQFVSREKYLNVAKMWDESVFNDMSIVQMLQIVLMYGQVSMCKPFPPGLTTSLTLASSIVQQLGLYQENNRDNPYIQDLKRRMFWCTYLMDRYVNVNAGKPFMISEDYISTEYFSLLDDKFIQQDFDSKINVSTQYSSKSVTLLYIEFFKVLSEIKLVLHSPKGSSRRNIDISKLSIWKSNTLEQLEDLKLNISEELKFSGYCSEYLYLIYHQAVAWLYRPSIIMKKVSVDDMKMLFLTGKSIIKCFRKLHIQKKITFRMLSVNTLFIGAMYYLYSIKLCREIQDSITEDEIECDLLILELVITSLRETCAISSFCLDLIKSMGDDVLKTVEQRKISTANNAEEANFDKDLAEIFNEDIRSLKAFDIDEFSVFSLFESFDDLPWDSYQNFSM